MARRGARGRVQGGAFRGRLLEGLPGEVVRPTTGMLKEALFSMLGDRVVEATVWDCFAGTGALGLEALSRGAARVTFVERANRSLAVLRRNVEALDVGDRVAVLRADALKPTSWGGDPEPGHLILADPPYGSGLGEAFLRALPPSLLRPGGRVAIEHEAKTTVQADAWRCLRTRTYGESALSLFARGDD